jgi:hypothetical protein
MGRRAAGFSECRAEGAVRHRTNAPVAGELDGTRRGTNSSSVIGMRKHLVLLAGLALAGIIACDSTDFGTVAGVNNSNGSNTTTALTVLPIAVQITVGSNTQLSTNAGNSALAWFSSDNNVATVSSTGLVTGRGVGTATITVRFTTDTANVATSNISVTQ